MRSERGGSEMVSVAVGCEGDAQCAADAVESCGEAGDAVGDVVLARDRLGRRSRRACSGPHWTSVMLTALLSESEYNDSPNAECVSTWAAMNSGQLRRDRKSVV